MKVLIFIVLFLTGCTSMQSISVSQPAKSSDSGEYISVSYDFGYSPSAETPFAKDTFVALRKLCPKGRIRNLVSTLYTTTLFFFFDSYNLQVEALCVD